MKLLEILRKPYLSILFASLVLFVSCNQYDELIDGNKIDATTLKSLHQNIKKGLDDAKSTTTLDKSNLFEGQVFEEKYIENVNYINKNGLESLLNKNEISIFIKPQVDFFMENKNDENVYQLLLDKFEINTLKDATFLFNTIELSKIIEETLNQSKSNLILKSQLSAKISISWGCAFAIAATVGCTLAFIFASGGSALLFAGALKGLATVALIEACGEGWGDI